MTERHSDTAARGDTRTRIQQVAMDLFAEQGYDKTSLREIAERLEVTKAALYYHFKSKEEIVESAVGDYLAQVDQLLEWGQAQPATLASRQEIVQRYADLVSTGSRSMHFFRQNPAQGAKMGGQFRERMRSIVELLVDADAPAPDQLRAVLAIFGLAAGQMLATDEGAPRGGKLTKEEAHQAALAVSLELIEPR